MCTTEVLRVTERPAVRVDADDSLLTAIRRLRQNHVHRVLVIDSDTGNAVHVLTQRSILEFLASQVSLSLSVCLFVFPSVVFVDEDYKKDGYRQQNVRQRQKLISIINYDVCILEYLQQFWRYSPSKNGLTLKSGYGVLQGH